MNTTAYGIVRQRRHRLASVADHVHATAQLLEHASRYELIDGGVFGHQHQRRRSARPRPAHARSRASALATAAVAARIPSTDASVLSNWAGRAGFVSTAANRSAWAVFADRRQQHQRRAGDGRLGADGARQHQAVHARHVHIQDRHRKRSAVQRRLAQVLQGARAVGDGRHQQTARRELLAQDGAVGGVVVDRQHAQAAQFGDSRAFGRRARACRSSAR